MKALKNLILSIFLVSVFCVISYGQTCSCVAETSGAYDSKQMESDYIPPGTDVSWSLSITTFNEATYNYTSALATIIGAPTTTVLQYKNTGNYYLHTDNSNGVWYNCPVDYVLLLCSARQGPRDSGGGAYATARVSW
ncbi:MAG: hypothetical protein PVH88_02680 [Ignavibacteria bacterium]|jgi:hypothetical protein